MTLAKATQALERGDEPRALDALVTAWRSSRSAEIAALAERLSARLEPHLPPLGGKLDEFQPRWLAIANQQRAVDLPRLLGSVLHGTDRFGVAVVDALVARGQALATWPADPRASAMIADHLVRGGYESTSRSTYPFWTAMFEMLESHADPRIVDRLAAIKFARVFRNFTDKAKRIAWFQEQLDRVVAALRARAAAPRAVDVTKVAKLIAKRGPVDPSRLPSDPAVPAKPPKRVAPAPKLDTASARTQIDAAVRALHAGDDGAALRALLDAWRATRSGELAELVERVSARCAARLPPIAEANRAATQKAWLAICHEQRPEDLPRLLASITTTFGRSTDALARAEALASRPSDPRTLAGVLAQLEAPPFYTSSTKPFWKALIGLVVDHHDPRAADALDALAARYHRVLVQRYTDLTSTVAWFKSQLGEAAAQLRARVPAPLALDAATARACHKITAVLAQEDQLLAEIVENLDDDHPRAVYADLLQQRGDPRGELIALQLSGADPARADELIRTHAVTWLGPLVPLVELDRCRFERGFLAEVRLRDGMSAHALEPVVGHPVWATVRTLHLGDRETPPAALLRHPIMRALATVMMRGRYLSLRESVDGTYQFVIGGAGARPRRWRPAARP